MPALITSLERCCSCTCFAASARGSIDAREHASSACRVMSEVDDVVRMGPIPQLREKAGLKRDACCVDGCEPRGEARGEVVDAVARSLSFGRVISLGPGQNGSKGGDKGGDDEGKTGIVTKSLYVESTAGAQSLMIRVNIPEQPGDMGNRLRNQQLALADRQAVFKGDCAVCHAAPTVGKLGEPLYQAACAICHAPEHRATMVTDLAVARTPRDASFWTDWIANGRDKTLMPGFSKAHGGPLTDEQVLSLVAYALKTFPVAPAVTPLAR